MVKKLCKVCGDLKDSEKGFYKTSGYTCKDCKKKQCAEYRKTAEDRISSALMELLQEQQEINQELRAHMDDMEKEMRKIRKALKKLSTS
jgi:gas vesicle protein